MSDASKPQSVVRFEWLYLAGIAAWLMAVIVKFSVVGLPSHPPLPFVVLALALVVALQAFIWFFIARRGSNVVRWLLCVFVVFALIGLPDSWAKGPADRSGLCRFVDFPDGPSDGGAFDAIWQGCASLALAQGPNSGNRIGCLWLGLLSLS